MISTRNRTIGEIVRNARLFRPRRQVMLDDQVAQIVDDLFGLLNARGIDYLLVGGIALLSYVEGRNTEDIGLILAISDLARLPELEVSTQDADFARAQYRGLQVDLLLTRNPFFDFIRQTYAARRDFNGREIAVVEPEGLILLKLYALPSLYRQGDFGRVALYETDLVMLLHRYPMGAETITAVLHKHLAEHDVKALREILDEIAARIRRYTNRAP
jgi:hypothetical protein